MFNFQYAHAFTNDFFHDRCLMIAFMGTNIMPRNCQGISIRSKRKELELYLKENNFDIVALNETFLTKKIISKFKVMIQ